MNAEKINYTTRKTCRVCNSEKITSLFSLGNLFVSNFINKEEKGLASALAEGIKKTKGNIIVWMDCDLGLPPEDIPQLVNKLNEFDIAIGSRYVKGGKDTRPWFRGFLSKMINLFARILLGNYVKDYTSGFIAVKKQVLNEITFSTKGFGEYFTEFIFKAGKKGFKITEVGYIYTERKKGKSKSDGDIITLFKLGIEYGISIIKLFLKNISKKNSTILKIS
jgi:dolichol-phosphate mannosyltransferase